MKTTKIVEIEICDLCETEMSDWQKFTCAGCLQKKHKCCQNYFMVDISHSKPTPASQSEMSAGVPLRPMAHTSVGRPEKFQFRGAFCEECEPRISQILAVSGLVKSKGKLKEDCVVLD